MLVTTARFISTPAKQQNNSRNNQPAVFASGMCSVVQILAKIKTTHTKQKNCIACNAHTDAHTNIHSKASGGYTVFAF